MFISALITVPLLLVVSPPLEGRVSTERGAAVEGELIDCSHSEVSLLPTGGDAPDYFDQGDLLSLTLTGQPPQPSESTRRVLLADGSTMAADSVSLADRVLKLTGPDFPAPLTVPADAVELVVLQKPLDTLKAYRELEDADLTGDTLLVVSKKTGAIDSVTGVVEAITDSGVRFRWDGDTIDVRRSKVAGVAFFRGERTHPAAVCGLTTRGGSNLLARRFHADGQNLRVELSAGVQIDLPLAEVSSIDYTVGRYTYLSDLTPSKSVWTPIIALPDSLQTFHQSGSPRFNHDFTGKTIALEWPDGTRKEYAKGMAARSRTVLRWRVPAGMQRFQATVGIDPATRSQGAVELVVRADKRVIAKVAIIGTDEPIEIDEPLGDARSLTLRVDYGENSDFGDRVHLAGARLVK